MSRLIRWSALMLAALLLFSAALAEDATGLRGYSAKEGYLYVTLGQFEQTAESEMEPIIWRVLTSDGESAQLCSEYVLQAHRTHGDYKEYEKVFKGDFAQTELALYLNNEFAEHAFTEAELNLLIPDEKYGRIYLLTAADLKDKSLGFGTDKARKAWGTPYAIEVTGLFVYGHKYGKHSPYWVMDQSISNKQGARCVKQAGDIGYINVITLNEGMRPTCVLDLTQTLIVGGEGTLESPYQLAPMAE